MVFKIGNSQIQKVIYILEPSFLFLSFFFFFFVFRPKGARCVLPGWMGEKIGKRVRLLLKYLLQYLCDEMAGMRIVKLKERP